MTDQDAILEPCQSCDGTGEFQGGRRTLQKPLCPDCKGTGRTQAAGAGESVYMLEFQPADNVYLVGIFTSLKKANKMIEAYHDAGGASKHDFTITRVPLDKDLDP